MTNPTIATVPVVEVEDGGRRCFDGALTAQQIHDLHDSHVIFVIDEEQRGKDPVTGLEVLNDKKVGDWTQRELDGELHMGQITLCLHVESGTTYEYDAKKNALSVYGGSAIADGRQRVYTLNQAVRKHDQGLAPDYDPERRVSVRFYVDLDVEDRKELFTQMNGGRGGDHADQGRVAWMAPETPGEVIAKRLVNSNPNLGTDNVNVVRNKVGRNDSRICGFNTMANAIGNAWNKPMTKAEIDKVAKFLNDFWNKLVSVCPDLKVLPLGERLVVRDRSLVGNPLAIYGFIRLAKRVYDMDPASPPLDHLDGLDPSWFDIGQAHWKEIGVLVPTFDLKTHQIKHWKVRNAFQTRKAMADWLVDQMFEEEDDVAVA